MFFLFIKLTYQRERKQKKLYSEDWALNDDDIEGRRTFSIQQKLEDPAFAAHNMVKEMHGTELNVAYFQRNGFNTPLLFKEKTGLGGLLSVAFIGNTTTLLIDSPLTCSRFKGADVEFYHKRRQDVRRI